MTREDRSRLDRRPLGRRGHRQQGDPRRGRRGRAKARTCGSSPSACAPAFDPARCGASPRARRQLSPRRRRPTTSRASTTSSGRSSRTSTCSATSPAGSRPEGHVTVQVKGVDGSRTGGYATPTLPAHAVAAYHQRLRRRLLGRRPFTMLVVASARGRPARVLPARAARAARRTLQTRLAEFVSLAEPRTGRRSAVLLHDGFVSTPSGRSRRAALVERASSRSSSSRRSRCSPLQHRDLDAGRHGRR